jgi:1D-myo-inositol-tetrakisphosphate 5-kinase/inositol-polyphosphate multikinase
MEASDGSGLHPHLVLQDVVSSCLNPSIMDIKIGSRTWYPEASEEYIQRCFKKDTESTSLALGFLIFGLQVHGSNKSGIWKPDKKLIKSFTAKDVRLVLRKFVSSNTCRFRYGP